MSTTVYDQTCRVLARCPLTKEPVSVEPILHQIDPRQLSVGDVFLFDGREETVTWTNWQPINCRLEVNTARGRCLLFTRDSDLVTVVL